VESGRTGSSGNIRQGWSPLLRGIAPAVRILYELIELCTMRRYFFCFSPATACQSPGEQQ
jgi:hypothetical protein